MGTTQTVQVEGSGGTIIIDATDLKAYQGRGYKKSKKQPTKQAAATPEKQGEADVEFADIKAAAVKRGIVGAEEARDTETLKDLIAAADKETDAATEAAKKKAEADAKKPLAGNGGQKPAK